LCLAAVVEVEVLVGIVRAQTTLEAVELVVLVAQAALVVE
jgi:hypothetical protein